MVPYAALQQLAKHDVHAITDSQTAHWAEPRDGQLCEVGMPLSFPEPSERFSQLKAWLNDLLVAGTISDDDVALVYRLFRELKWA